MPTLPTVRSVTFDGMPLKLTGGSPPIGAAAPEFTVLDASLSPVRLADFRGKTVVIASLPSLDTPVCDMEARIFNERIAGAAGTVTLLAISMDLPFAQARWCAAAVVDQVLALSDHRDAAFGLAYGLLIAELRLLARAVLVIDADGILRYRQLVPDIGQEPDYDDVMAAVQLLR